MPDSVPGHANETLNFLIGFLVSVAASIMNAAGLNLLKLDHEKNSSKPSSLQRNECGRPLWHVGLYLYVASQMVGSTIALNFLKAQWVAPLGSVSLIFNFVFARMLVGTKITRKDIIGTFVVILSVIWIVIFGGVNAGNNDEYLTLGKLKSLMIRPLFIVYFSFLDIITFGLFAIALYSYWILNDEDRKQRDNFYKGIDSLRLQKAIGMTMAGVGGLIASQTLLLAKSGVKLFSISMTGNNQFTDNLSWFILVGLAVTAVMQVYCLNTALKLHDSVLVVPMFYGFYTAMGLVNTMIYLDEISTYPLWALLLVTFGIGSLVVDSMDFEIDEEEEMREENMLDTKAWDIGSTSGASSSGGSYVGILNRDRTANNRSGGGKKKFGDGRFFSFSKKSSNSKPGLFRMSLLKGGKHKLRDLDNTKDSHNDSDMNNYTTPHIIIDDESISDDEDYIQEQRATTPSITSPATAATTDLMLFSPTSTNINSSTAIIQPISSTTSNFNPLLRHRLVDNVYENEIMFSRSFDDLLNTDELTIDKWSKKKTTMN
ncbi:13620_t:CDS:2 [Funneliformis caledonium]|uniref:13620_t:CDS:1 n=1 Tax=Funneliformis caledonium TaxID=1117310 RepID=A0A9N9DSY1_9GLOM|nr:13620_t:CDS:2 [Funneliformis caledonium]